MSSKIERLTEAELQEEANTFFEDFNSDYESNDIPHEEPYQDSGSDWNPSSTEKQMLQMFTNFILYWNRFSYFILIFLEFRFMSHIWDTWYIGQNYYYRPLSHI
jgi:hypothetical protein